MSNLEEDLYLDLLNKIITTGEDRQDRTGVGAKSLFGERLQFDLTNNKLPLLTTKKVHYKSVLLELLWFLKGLSDNEWLKSRGVTIWNEWDDPEKGLGPIYGVQWRSWYGGFKYYDQITSLMDQLHKNPQSRRHIVSAWNVGELDKMALAPCHLLFQCYVHNDNSISLQVYQRSADMFLGVPFNIASYATLAHIIAHSLGTTARSLTWVGGDVHIYSNHMNQVKEQLSRHSIRFPTLSINGGPYVDLGNYSYENFTLNNYHPQAAIKAQVAI